MLATIARFGESGWQDYWRGLRANGVLVVDGWEEAYTAAVLRRGRQHRASGPIVVSYATSPAAEVIFATKPPTTAPDRGRRGQLLPADRATPASSPARRTRTARAQLIDFMLSERFQAAVPESMFVLPGARRGHRCRRRSAATPSRRRAARRCPAAEIGRNRDRWIDEWTRVVLR